MSTSPAVASPTLADPSTAEERELFARLDLARLPRHVAIIMDGNGRWARRRSLASRVHGHEAGTESVRAAVRTAAQLRLRALTLYAFSKENWSRPRTEIEALMALLDRFLEGEIPEMMENNIRLVAMGDLGDLRAGTRQRLDRAMEATGANTGLVLNLALSYGGRQEIAAAAARIAADAVAGRIRPGDVNEETVSRYMFRPELGDPELLVRTSGELRVSNFMLWQIAYTELVILDVLWPDFRRIHLLSAIEAFQKRERRFGGVGAG